MLWGDISGGMMRFDEIFKNGLHARYTYKSWNQEWKTWGDVSGNNRDGKASGSGFSSGCDRNQNGWDGVVCSVRGNVNSRVTFGDGSIPPTFTICSVSRYNGPSRGRILNGDSNWLHGHWAGYVGVAYYEGWKTPVPSTSTPQLDWLLFCGQNAPPNIFLANGRAVSNGAGGGRSNIAFGINSLGCCGVCARGVLRDVRGALSAVIGYVIQGRQVCTPPDGLTVGAPTSLDVALRQPMASPSV